MKGKERKEGWKEMKGNERKGKEGKSIEMKEGGVEGRKERKGK